MRELQFFSQQPVFHKRTFQKKLDVAIELIASNKSDIARMVLKAIHSQKVTISPFNDVSAKHFLLIKENHISKKDLRFVSGRFPPTRAAVRIFESTLDGILMGGNQIYVCSKLSDKQMASTLIHEVAHYLNDALYDQDLADKPFEVASYKNELRSYTAEKSFEKNGLRLLRSDITVIHRKMIKSYPELVGEEAQQRQALGFVPGIT